MKEFGETHGFEPLTDAEWVEVEDFFHQVDTSGDGAWDIDELATLL